MIVRGRPQNREGRFFDDDVVEGQRTKLAGVSSVVAYEQKNRRWTREEDALLMQLGSAISEVKGQARVQAMTAIAWYLGRRVCAVSDRLRDLGARLR